MGSFLYGFALGFAWFCAFLMAGIIAVEVIYRIHQRRVNRQWALAARCRAAYDRSTYSGEYIYGKN